MNSKAKKLHSRVHARPNVIELPGHSGDAQDNWQGMIVGVLVGFAADGSPLVDFPNRPSAHALEAQHTIDLGVSNVGREITIMFANSDPYRPVVTGVCRSRRPRKAAGAPKFGFSSTQKASPSPPNNESFSSVANVRSPLRATGTSRFRAPKSSAGPLAPSEFAVARFNSTEQHESVPYASPRNR